MVGLNPISEWPVLKNLNFTNPGRLCQLVCVMQASPGKPQKLECGYPAAPAAHSRIRFISNNKSGAFAKNESGKVANPPAAG